MANGPEDVASAARRTVDRISQTFSGTELPLTITGAVVFLCGVVLAIAGSKLAIAALGLGAVIVLIGYFGPMITRRAAKKAKEEIDTISRED